MNLSSPICGEMKWDSDYDLEICSFQITNYATYPLLIIGATRDSGINSRGGGGSRIVEVFPNFYSTFFRKSRAFRGEGVPPSATQLAQQMLLTPISLHNGGRNHIQHIKILCVSWKQFPQLLMYFGMIVFIKRVIHWRNSFYETSCSFC